MRVRNTYCNSSFSMSFDDFKSDILDVNECLFTWDYEQFHIIGMPKGIVTDTFDVFWESEDERVAFIEFMDELGY